MPTQPVRSPKLMYEYVQMDNGYWRFYIFEEGTGKELIQKDWQQFMVGKKWAYNYLKEHSNGR